MFLSVFPHLKKTKNKRKKKKKKLDVERLGEKKYILRKNLKKVSK